MILKEDLLQFIWKYRLFEAGSLKSHKGERIDILNTGHQNKDSGPDFINCKIFIKNRQWIGNVEIHVDPADWYNHKHHIDPAYDSIILHVSYSRGKREIMSSSGRSIPQLILKDLIDRACMDKYLRLKESLNWIPCQSLQPDYNQLLSTDLELLAVERILNKSVSINKMLESNKNDWELTLKMHLISNFGMKANREGFQALSSILNYQLIDKLRYDLFRLEAVLFGQSGLLNQKSDDVYVCSLRSEYDYLKHLYPLYELKNVIWKFSKLRPSNFPTLRIAQLASLLYNQHHFLNEVLRFRDIEEISSFFGCEISPYWKIHYHFGKRSVEHNRKMGKQMMDSLIINSIVPFVHFYGNMRYRQDLTERSLNLLYQIKPEVNSIVSKWRSTGVKAINALETQALIQLKTEYCDRYRCLECSVGKRLIRNTQ